MKYALKAASIFHPKAKKWVDGRKNQFQNFEKINPTKKKIIWMHCASLGEYEQGKPVFEKLKVNYPNYFFLLSFFSPSGFENQKKNTIADAIIYLPADTVKNATRFIQIFNPCLVLWVKYEYWANFLFMIKKNNIPLLMISALFRQNQPFFKPNNSFHSKILSCFTHFFVQDENSKNLLHQINFYNTTISGDTRVDRVLEIKNNFTPNQIIEKFVLNHKVLIAGSTWPNDELLLKKLLLNDKFSTLKLIIAPHEINTTRINFIKKKFKGALQLSHLDFDTDIKKFMQAKVLIIDCMGKLSNIYYYATISYVGGGFNKSGIHNVLEPAVFYKPVIWGKYYKKFIDAVGLKSAKGGFSVENENNLEEILNKLLIEENFYSTSAEAAGNFVLNISGATNKIFNYIQINLFLTI